MTPTQQPTPTPAPTVIREPDHEFDFRGCSDISPTNDTGVDGAGIVATAYNNPICSAEGMVFDSASDYVDVTPWQFGGSITVEAYAYRTSQNGFDRIFHFSDSENSDKVALSMINGEANSLYFYTATSVTDDSSSFSANQWVHIVATHHQSTLTSKIYVDGDFKTSATGTTTIANIERTFHAIGTRSSGTNSISHEFSGTIAYLRFWHGEALDADQVAELYADS